MRLLIGLIAVLLAPSVVSAGITSNTSASSQTGGNTAGPGQTVTTGESSASVSTSNVSGKSSSSFYIKTDANGVVHEESSSSDSSDVSVKVQSTPAGTVVETREGASAPVMRTIPKATVSVQAEATSSTQEATTTDTTYIKEGEVPGLGTTIVLSIQNFFAGLFGWLW